MFRLKSLVVLVASTLALLFALLFVLQLATSDRVQAKLEALLTERTGLTTRINGDVTWRYLWPTAVELNAISASSDSGSEQWLADTLRLELNSLSIFQAPATPGSWQVSGIRVTNLHGNRSANITSERTGEQYAIHHFAISNLRSDQPAPFEATLHYNELGAEPIAATLTGNLRLIANERRLHFEPANLSGDVVSGICNANIALRQISDAATTAPTQQHSTLLNTDLWRRSDWELNCELESLTLKNETFKDVKLTSNNLLGNGQSQLTLPIFFTGNAELNLTIDASNSGASSIERGTPRWVLTPIITNVASDPFLQWLRSPDASNNAPVWQGPVSITGRIETNGNNRTALLDAAQGEITMVSNNGTLDLTAFKARMDQPLDELKGLIGDAETIRNWPDTLEYLTLEGRWTPTDGGQHITGRLDNVVLDTNVVVRADPVSASRDTLAASGTITFSTKQLPLSLPVPPLLEDLPLPMNCIGAPTAPQCGIDTKAAKQLLADVLRGGGPDGLSEKIDAIIDDKVPAKYRRAARSLLEILGHSIDDKDAAEMDDFLDEEMEEELDSDSSEI